MAESSGVTRFRALTEGVELEIHQMTETTHTAAEAAKAVGAPVEAIVKSLVFQLGDQPVLLLVSGPNRVNTEAVGAYLGAELGKADAAVVKATTGYSIGGVPPFGHVNPVRTLMDEDLLRLEQVWAAAGSANAVFPIAPDRLRELSGAEVVSIY